MLFSLASCNSRQKEEAAAEQQLDKIRDLISQNKLNAAKIEIDSLHTSFPRLVNKRKEAVALKDSIILRESYRTVEHCNKVLPNYLKVVNELEQSFTFIKNEKYEEVGRFAHKTQSSELNTSKNYLAFEVDEDLNTFLTSTHKGTKLNHYAIKAEASAGLFATTDQASKTGVSHTYNIDSNPVEQLTFKNEADGGIAKFIHENYNQDIKITLIGIKDFKFTLTKSNKEAISKTYLLANAQKLLRNTEKENRIAQQRIGKIKLLYNN